MVIYDDYFDNSKLRCPYEKEGEQNREALQLLDMMLDYFALKKDEVNYAGVALTKNRMEKEREKLPFQRREDQHDLFLAHQIRTALSHIKSRSELTEDASLKPFSVLKDSFALSDFEMLVVLLGYSSAAHLKYQATYESLNAGARKLPVAGLAYSMFIACSDITEGEFRDYMEPQGKLRSLLLDSAIKSDGIFLLMPILLSRATLGFLSGQVSPLGGMAGLTEQVFDGEVQEFLLAETEVILQDSHKNIFLKAGDEEDALFIASVIAAREHKNCLALDLISLEPLAENTRLEAVRTAAFMSMTRPTALVLTGCGENLNENRIFQAVIREIRAFLPEQKLYFIGKAFSERDQLSNEAALYSMNDCNPESRRAAFLFYLGDAKIDSNVDIERLSDCYEISIGRIKKVCSQARLQAESCDRAVSRDDVLKGLFQMNRSHFGLNAKPIPAVYSWDQLEIEDKQRELLMVACKRYLNRKKVQDMVQTKKSSAYGGGESILLYGPPGTGKTMAAQVIANELGMELYRIDLSQIVSKYIGETQKNLSKIFDDAEGANAILFFDEADALFSKRTEVSDSNDKHANSETAFLLQRIEEYSGLCVLATNLYSNFDAAFLRRITYAVKLENPGPQTRLKLWKNTLPKTVAVGQIDFEYLAENFEFSGSNIKAILHSAVYMAVSENSPVENKHIAMAMKYEMEKLGKMVSFASFGPFGMWL